MGWNTPDVYSQPEKFGLVIVGSICREPNYDFYILMVWKHMDGRLFWAEDSGCSCPSPFEDFTSLEWLHEITEEKFDYFCEIVRAFNTTRYSGLCPEDEAEPDPPLVDRELLIQKAWKALNAPRLLDKIHSDIDRILEVSTPE